MHPCRSCGACCAAYRVRFPAREIRDLGVPRAATEPWIKDHVQLRRQGGVCASHVGVVGRDSTCGIYGNRPSPCRDRCTPLAGGPRLRALLRVPRG